MFDEVVRTEDQTLKKRAYLQPRLTVLGDVAEITMGDDLGEELDAMFRTTHSPSASKGKKKNGDRFS